MRHKYMYVEGSMKTHPELPQPFLALIRLFLAKREINELTLAILRRAERDHMLCHMREIVTSIRVLARSETLNYYCQYGTGRQQ